MLCILIAFITTRYGEHFVASRFIKELLLVLNCSDYTSVHILDAHLFSVRHSEYKYGYFQFVLFCITYRKVGLALLCLRLLSIAGKTGWPSGLRRWF